MPEQKARREIDANLAEAGWIVQDRDEIDLTAGSGIAVRDEEFDPGNEEGSGFDSARPWQGERPDVVYSACIPPEFFDFITFSIRIWSCTMGAMRQSPS